MSPPDQQSNLVIGVEDHDLLPYAEYREECFTGVLTSILDHISAEKQLDLDLKPYAPWELNDLLDTGKVAIRFPDNPAWHSGDSVKMFSDPVVRFIDQYYSRSDKVPDLSEPVTVGSIQGYTLPVSDQSKYVCDCKWYDSNLHLSEALRDGAVDVIYGNSYALEHRAKGLGLSVSRFPYFPPREGFYHFSCRMDHSGLLMEINDWIRRHRLQLDNWAGESWISL